MTQNNSVTVKQMDINLLFLKFRVVSEVKFSSAF